MLFGADSVSSDAGFALSGAGFVLPDAGSSHAPALDFLCFLLLFFGDWLPFGGVTSPVDDLDTETDACRKPSIIAR